MFRISEGRANRKHRKTAHRRQRKLNSRALQAEALEDRRLLAQNVISAGGDGQFLIGDFDGNKADDVMWISSSGHISAIDGHTRRPLQTWWNHTIPGWPGNGDYLAGDFNGDNVDDLLFVRSDAHYFIVNGKNASQLSSLWWGYAIPGWSGDSDDLLVGDFNGNGKDDLMFIRNDGRYYAVDGGNGASISGWWGRQIPGWPGNAREILVGDFNGNGTDDLMYIHPDARYYIVEGSNGGAFSSPWWGYEIPGWTGDTNHLVVGDFDHNGRDDLMYVRGDGRYYAVDGRTGGQVAGWWGTSPAGWPGNNSQLLIGDLNASGSDDLIFRRNSDDRFFAVEGRNPDSIDIWYNQTYTNWPSPSGERLPLPAAPTVSYIGSSGTRVDSANSSFKWSVSDVNGDLSSAKITLQKQQANGSWASLRSSSWGLTSLAFGVSTDRTISIADSDLRNHGLGKYRATILVMDRTGRQRSHTSSTVTVIDDDTKGPVISLNDHLGQTLSGGSSVTHSHGESPSIHWSVTDKQAGSPDSGVSSVEVVVRKQGQVVATGDGEVGEIDLSNVGPGIYAITIKAFDNDRDRGSTTSVDFASTTITGTIQLTNEAPELQVGVDRWVKEGELNDYLVVGSSDADGDDITFDWDFGSEESSETGASVSHAFKDQGTYTVTVTASDAFGGATTDSLTVYVENVAPRIESVAVSPMHVVPGQAVTVTVDANDVIGDTVTYEVDWDADGTYDESNNTGVFSLSFSSEGLFIIPVRVSDEEGGINLSDAIVQVGNPPSSLPTVNFSISSQSVVESDGHATVTAILSEPTSVTVAVPLAISGTADTTDYGRRSQYLIIPAGEVTASYTLEIVEDDLDEPHESLILTMGTPFNASAGGVSVHTLTIVDNDPIPEVWFATSGAITPEAQRAITATVRLSNPSSRTIVVPLEVSGTALPGADINLAENLWVTIPAGQLYGSLDIQVLDDALPEANETVILRMLAPEFAVLSNQASVTTSYVLTILENDAPSVSFSTVYQVVDEGAGTVTVTAELSASHFKASTATAQLEGTVSGSDISPVSSITFNFPVGVTSASQTITINDDAVPEPAEHIVPRLTAVTGDIRVGSPASSVVTIVDNDVPKVSFSTGWQAEFEGNTAVPVEISVSPVAPEDIVIPIQLLAGTATRLLDFDMPSEVTIPAGRASTTLYVQLTEDSNLEADETINLALGAPQDTLGAPSLAIVGDTSHHTLTVRNDDVHVRVTASAYDPTESNSTVELTVALSPGPTDEPVNVTLSGRGTAELGQDYTIAGSSTSTTQITIPAGATSVTQIIHLLDDTTAELFESLDFDVSGSGALSFNGLPVPILIVDNDATTVSFGVNYSEHSEGANRVAIPIRLNVPAEYDIPVIVSDPRKASPDIVTIPTGQTSVDYWVSTDNDSSLDVTKHIVLRLVDALGAGLGGTGTHELVIFDDDRRSGFYGELEYSHFINKRGYDELIDKAEAGFNDWLDHVEGFDWEEILVDAALLAHKKILSSAVCSALGYSTSAAGVFYTGGFGAVWASLGAIAVTEACSFVVEEVADRTIYASVNDGPIVDYQAFFDANKNGVLDFVDTDQDGVQDPGELSEPTFEVTTAGMLFGAVPEEFDANDNGRVDTDDGQLVAIGGTDLSTHLPISMPLTAPWHSAVVTPLTTLASELVNDHNYTAADAATRVLEAFGLPEFDLLLRDPVIRAAKGDAVGAAVFERGASLHSTVKQVAALISSLPNAPDERTVGLATYSEFASAIQSAGSKVDISNQYVLAAIIESTAARYGISVPSGQLEAAALAMAASNYASEQIPLDASVAYMEAVAQVQVVAQGTVSNWLAEMAVGVRNSSEFVTLATGSNLQDLIDHAVVGTVILPEISISDGKILEGDSGEQLMEFAVSLSDPGKEAISVRFSTVDVSSATTLVDFAETHGTLTWQPGDASTKTILVPIYGDTEFEGEERLELWLDAPVNAVISGQAGMGRIVDDEPFIYQAPDDDGNSAIVINVLDGNRLIITRNDVQVLNQVLGTGQSVEIYGSGIHANEFKVSASTTATFPVEGIQLFGGSAEDTLIVNDSLASAISLTRAGSDGAFVFDGNRLLFESVERIQDTWTPDLIGVASDWDEGGTVELELDFSNSLQREETAINWLVNDPLGARTVSNIGSVSFVPGDNGLTSVNVTMVVPNGPQVDILLHKHVLNVDPSIEFVSISDLRREGTAIHVDSIVSDPATDHDVLTYSYAVYKNGALYEEQSGVDLTAYSFTPDDNGAYELVLTVADEDGGSDSVSHTISVGNVAPRINSLENVTFGSPVSAPSIGAVVGQTLQFRGIFTDDGINDTHLVTVDWGDGSGVTALVVSQQAGGGHASGEHIYEAAGTYRVIAELTDNDGDMDRFEVEIVVVTSALLPDTWNPELAAVYAGGTMSADKIEIRPGEEAGTVEVWINHSLDGIFAPTGRLIIFGQAGDDDIQIMGSVTHDAWIDGGAGDDRLKGGAGNDVLIGALGDDLLLGKSGRDFLLGGRGSDRIVGNADDDILIAGWLAFANEMSILQTIMDEWTSERSYQQRIENLTETLVLGGSVLDDEHDTDKITGSAGNDWFFFDEKHDRATDLTDEVFANDLDWIES